GTSPHGQGHHTAWAMIVSDALGIALDDVEVVHGDTDVVPMGTGTFGSRSLQLGGMAVHRAAEDVIEQARQLAAELLEANPDDIVVDKVGGRLHVAGTPAVSKSWAELAGAAAANDGGGLAAEVLFESTMPTFPFGAHVAVVEVDTETGRVELTRFVAVDDAGTIVNPLIVEGQVHGGVATGVALALYESYVYDEDGTPLTTSLVGYAFPSAA